ncbi:CBN-SMGL-2 protein [Caenorhabditis brenneri]|uniref:CBN-SMGL-2 protein n=1 Tax=Caenorhabditis brenneri TaxID=135651 RepID=G0NLZ9_CAEBE|nr:CBN-SMGL-2 protein [Caenorhabditis brenneri]
MYKLTQDEYEKYRGALFRHFLPDEPGTSRDGNRRGEKSAAQELIETKQKSIQSYFNRFFRERKGETNDHFDMNRVKYDDLGIPQDTGGLNRLRFKGENLGVIPTQLNHVPPWLYRHFEYAQYVALQFNQHQKFQKLQKLRKLQKELPIAERAEEIVELLKTNQVLIVAGDTGCGKSTQVPQYLLKAGYTGVACTQPRRIACTALARRVAFETLNQYGSEVAFQIRFETTKSQRTKLLFLTEGLLLRQMEKDSLLEKYNVIILDEVHERHLTSDLLIGLLRDLCSKREDLKLILMSATINLDLFKGYFEGAPVVQVPGRLFPIDVRWHPIKQFIEQSEKKTHKIDPEPYLRILELIDKQFPSTQRGDALIFLNGVAEISMVAEHLKNYAEQTKGWIILMLHSTLSVEEQDKVFDQAPTGVRKCILSTNVAETSVTIDGIRFVIDSGKVNLIKHEPGTGTQKLTEFWVSKASANQRKGRAGRTGPGICYRLYSQEQFEKMEDFTQSEINRVSLQEMSLKMISLNLGLDPRTFPFIEKPSEDVLNEGLETLKFQRVLRSDRELLTLTSLGNMVSKLPVDVPIAKMLVYGCVVDELEVMLTVAAGLSVQSPFTNRSYRELEIVERRASLTSPMGDPFTLIAVFREWVLQKAFEGTARRWTMENGIDEHRLYEISKLRAQYRQILEDAGLVEKATAAETGEDDSRQRRIDQGEKKKLFDLKKSQRNNDRRQKVLNANKHFDKILEDKEEEDLEAEKDPLKADVKTVEFLLSHKQRDVETIRKTHKISRRTAEVIRVIIAAGLYPNFSILDPVNKYGYGQEMFAHTRLKPFAQIHPNSSIAQYHPESIDPRQASDGFSRLHQIPFYGLLLETTKPYICNVMPVPAVYSLLVAQKIVIEEEWTELIVDDFLELKFRNSENCRSILLDAKEIRYELTKGLATKLVGDDGFSSRRLTKYIELLNQSIVEKGIELAIKRNIHPPKVLTGNGIHSPDGGIDKEEDVDDLVQRFEKNDPSTSQTNDDIEEEEQKVMDELRSDVMCPPTRDMVEEDEEKKKKKEVPKESYYEKLLKRQAAKEDGKEKDHKKPKIELDDVKEEIE